MPRSSATSVESAVDQVLPFCVVERRPRVAVFGKIILLSLAGIAGAAPIVMVTALSASTPDAILRVADNPLVGLQFATGLLFWILLLGMPFWRFVRSAGIERKVAIDAACVTIAERSLIGAREKVVPLTSYRGIAHRVRASLSGTRHELVLVGPSQRSNVVIATAPRMSEGDIERMCNLLGLKPVPAREVITRR
ncbi:MAG TPA: hypothetical protein PK264_12705 [Hyphomicrobiaceae bacterium]|nr:hypothetical protein [Hyphomicrobiaceae bacterium]